jgi:hypothetical protein
VSASARIESSHTKTAILLLAFIAFSTMMAGHASVIAWLDDQSPTLQDDARFVTLVGHQFVLQACKAGTPLLCRETAVFRHMPHIFSHTYRGPPSPSPSTPFES